MHKYFKPLESSKTMVNEPFAAAIAEPMSLEVREVADANDSVVKLPNVP